MDRNFVDEERLKQYFQNDNPVDSSYIQKVFLEESEKRSLKKVLEKQFEELDNENDINVKNLDHIYYKIFYNITSKKEKGKNRFIKWAYRIAGIILIPILLYVGINYRNSSPINNSWVEIKAPAWTRVQFGLPDGTTGWLNSNSGIRYKGNFTSERTVSLTGEAYFDVAKNPRKPFTVLTGEVNVKVVGTRFNIASYENENNVEVVLEEGKIVIGNKALDKIYSMKPNDLWVYNKEKKVYNVETVLSGKYTSWKEGKLVFRNDPVDVVARRLERWYNVIIINNIPVNEDIRWRATFEDEDLEKVLDIMQRTLPIRYKIEDAGINSQDIYSKKKITLTVKN